MVNSEILFLMCLVAAGASSVIYRPKVYEDNTEIKHYGHVRIARNSDSAYTSMYQPYASNFAMTKQHNNKKFRYTEQQKVSLVNGMAKTHRYLGQSQNINYKTTARVDKNSNDWQPFEPKTSKQNAKSVPGLFNFKIIKDIEFYKPGTNQDQVSHPRTLNSTFLRNGDLETQASEQIEKKIDIGDSSNEYNKLVLVHPNQNQLQEHLSQNSNENQNVNIKKQEGQLTTLNDLIGKNPNVQLEGLKRLLQEMPSKNYNVATIQGSEPFQSREHSTITEDVLNIPNHQLAQNIQVNQQDDTISIQTPHAIDKDSFDNIQKQLDEAAKIQTQQVLARAQQEAQAQVEAQHKAIALAQVQARQVALDNLKNSLYGNGQTLEQNNQAVPLLQNSQALPLVQNNNGREYENNQGGEYHDASNAQKAQTLQASPNSLPLHANNNHNRPSPYNIIQRPENPSANALEDNIGIQKLISQSGSPHLSLTSAKKAQFALHENIPTQAYGSKELLYYAPNHYHQAAAQRQAENALLAQVQAQNSAIINGHRSVPSTLRQILKSEQVSSETQDASDTHTVTETQPQPTAYQQIVLESNEAEEAAEEQKDYDDVDDYAAKYAFGYRIKDIKEGNDFGHEERRNGKTLEGSYHVLLPDGRLQKVEYYADKSGYHAKVTYEHLNHE